MHYLHLPVYWAAVTSCLVMPQFVAVNSEITHTSKAGRPSGLGRWSLILRSAGCGFDSHRHPVVRPSPLPQCGQIHKIGWNGRTNREHLYILQELKLDLHDCFVAFIQQTKQPKHIFLGYICKRERKNY